jgi:4-amino-4-deoxy-L-arabinose transferase-like glycosyltransferase
MRRTTTRTLALALILLLATGLRFYRLDAQSLWNDEGNAARAAERSPSLILEAAEGDIHPPGYYLLLHFWRAMVGQSEFALRSLSSLCGVLTVALTYVLGQRAGREGVGLGAALLGALAPLGVYYAQEARMYALLGLLSAASSWLFWILVIERKGGSLLRSRWAAVTYVLTAAAGLYTHYAFPFVLIVHNLLFLAWWIWRAAGKSGRWRRLFEWAGLQLAAALLFAPWLPVAWSAVTGWSAAGRGYTLVPALIDVLRVLTVGITMELAPARPALVIAGGVLLLGLWPSPARRRPSLPPALVLVAWLLVPVGLIFVFDLYKPAYLKFLMAVLPPFHLLLARGVENVRDWVGRLGPRVRTAAGVAARGILHAALAIPLLFSLHNLYFDPAYARDDYRQIAADITAASQPGDAILLNSANQWEVFTYYYQGDLPVYPIPRSRPPRPEAVAAELERIAADHDRLFVLYWGDTEADPRRLVEGWLAEHAYKTGDRWVQSVRMALYGLGPLPQEPTVSLDAHFGEEPIHLRGITAEPDSPVPGDILRVSLFWETEAPLDDRYKVFLHLLDDTGQLVAQTDNEPRDGLLPTTIWTPGEIVVDRDGILLPSDLSPGRYTLVTGLYYLVSGDRLAVASGATLGEDRLILAEVTVTAP